mmetsp:Transcript_31700/g.75329  ORF Transcript_31700/g.75329 Transcript_31700/m.75329 type:complete len:187 (-) Transcript_31700:5401-5961(-)
MEYPLPILVPFIHKLWEIVNNHQYCQVISWVKHGDCFEIFDIDRFSSHILPTFFKTKVLSSFTRQLNMYGFRKLKRDTFVYAHLNFKESRKDKLFDIRRKKNGSNKLVKNHENSLNLKKMNEEIEEIKKWKHFAIQNMAEICQRNLEIIAKIDEIEKKQNEINFELNQLKGDIFEFLADFLDSKIT